MIFIWEFNHLALHLLPNSHRPRLNWADLGIFKIHPNPKSQPNPIPEQMVPCMVNMLIVRSIIIRPQKRYALYRASTFVLPFCIIFSILFQKHNVQHRHTRGAEVRPGQRLGSGDVAQVALQPAGQDAGLNHTLGLRQARGEEPKGVGHKGIITYHQYRVSHLVCNQVGLT